MTGADTLTRSSTAVSRKVWVPPPEAPVQPIRSGSTSGRDCRKSTERMLFPELNPQPADAPQAEAPIQGTAVVLDLAAVVVGQHVVGKDHMALASQVDREARHRGEGLIYQPPVGPMAVGGQDSREGTFPPQRTVEIPGDVKPRIALKKDLLDGIVPLGDLPEDPRLEWALLHRRPQPGADLYLPAQIPGPLQPGILGQKRLEGIRQVQVAYPRDPPVHLRQTGQSLGTGRGAQQQEPHAGQ